jgi:hypothetical protein
MPVKCALYFHSSSGRLPFEILGAIAGQGVEDVHPGRGGRL